MTHSSTLFSNLFYSRPSMVSRVLLILPCIPSSQGPFPSSHIQPLQGLVCLAPLSASSVPSEIWGRLDRSVGGFHWEKMGHKQPWLDRTMLDHQRNRTETSCSVASCLANSFLNIMFIISTLDSFFAWCTKWNIHPLLWSHAETYLYPSSISVLSIWDLPCKCISSPHRTAAQP